MSASIRSGFAQIDAYNYQTMFTIPASDIDTALIATLNTSTVSEGGTVVLSLSRSTTTLTGALVVTLSTETPDGRITLPRQITLNADQQSIQTNIRITPDSQPNSQRLYTLTLTVPKARQDKYLLVKDRLSTTNRPRDSIDLSFTIAQNGQPRLLGQFNPTTHQRR